MQALQLQHSLEATSKALLFSRALVAEGCCVQLRKKSANTKGKGGGLSEFIKAAAAYVHLLVQPPDVTGDGVLWWVGVHKLKARGSGELLELCCLCATAGAAA